MTHQKTILSWLPGAALLLAPAWSNAGFTPLPLLPASFNQDIIVEQGAPPPLLPVTTASMETGVTNTGFSWYERGYNADWPATGLAPANSTVVSDLSTEIEYRLAPSYKTNNVILIDSDQRTGTFELVNPVACARLSFLATSSFGKCTLQITLHHQNGAVQEGTLVCPDWLDGARPAAAVPHGRVDVTGFTFSSVNQNLPALFGLDFSVSESKSPLKSIDFRYTTGTARAAIFAVSGSPETEGLISALEVTGYNADVVVEASAPRRSFLAGATTATLENGEGNWGYAWYERGYYPPLPESGLPAPASLLTNATAPDHSYQMPPSYSANNAILLDAETRSSRVTLTSPTPCASLSFLGGAGHGPATVECLVYHADGTRETNWFSLPDWLSGEPAALGMQQRLSLDFRVVDRLHPTGLFAADITLANQLSPVTLLDLTLRSGGSDTHAAILALSAASASEPDVRPLLSLVAAPGGALRLRTTKPGRLESTTTLSVDAVWQNEGPISSDVLVPAATNRLKFYRVVTPQ